jgi:hypothetical protein
METYDSARPERAQIEDSGFLNVRDFDGNVLSNDKSNHGQKTSNWQGYGRVQSALSFDVRVGFTSKLNGTNRLDSRSIFTNCDTTNFVSYIPSMFPPYHPLPPSP